MLAISNAGSRRARVLIEAIDEHEITIREFASAIENIPPEVLQVAAAVMTAGWDFYPDQMKRLWRARLLCRQIAEANRCQN
jgi:hypothetical protein